MGGKKPRCVVFDCLVSSQGYRVGNLAAIKHLIQVWEWEGRVGMGGEAAFSAAAFVPRGSEGLSFFSITSSSVSRLVFRNTGLLGCADLFILIIWYLCSDFHGEKEGISLTFGRWSRATEAGLQVSLESSLHSAVTLARML